MQWITITSFVPCYAPHYPQHVAVSLFGPLKQIMISSPHLPKQTLLSGLGISRQTSFNWSFLLLDGLPAKAMSSIHPSLGFV